MVGGPVITYTLCSLLPTATVWQSFFEGSGSKATGILVNNEWGPAVTYVKGKFGFRVSKTLLCLFGILGHKWNQIYISGIRNSMMDEWVVRIWIKYNETVCDIRICRNSYSMWHVTSVDCISWHAGKQTTDSHTSWVEKSTITQRYIRCQHDYVGFLPVGPGCETKQKAVWITMARMQLTCIIHLFSSFSTGLSSISQNFILSPWTRSGKCQVTSDAC